MKTSKLIVIVALAGLSSVSVGGAATWWVLKPHLEDKAGDVQDAPKSGTQGGAAAQSSAAVTDTRAFRYISLDKVIVMLRNTAGEPVSHYLAMDLVFMSPIESEKVTRDHLPLLRSVTVKALSQLTMDTASHLTVEQLTRQINDAYSQTYANDRQGKPFAEAMISKLIIE